MSTKLEVETAFSNSAFLELGFQQDFDGDMDDDDSDDDGDDNNEEEDHGSGGQLHSQHEDLGFEVVQDA
jgi:hypothetical protein